MNMFWTRRWARYALALTLTLPSAAFATLLSLTDPPGDAVGDGTLASPTAERFNTAFFDVRSVAVLDAPTFTFRLEFAALPPEGASAQPIADIYLDSEPGGAKTLLPGSDMQLADGGWEVAFQTIGTRLRVFTPNAEGTPVDASAALNARVVREGNTLLVTTSLATPERFSLYGVVGSYDPFSLNGWRSVALEAAPWRFSSPTQRRPVIDVIADDPTLQASATERGVLPEIRTSFRQERWLLLASAGMVIAFVGLALRFASKPEPPRGVTNTPTTNDAPASKPVDKPVNKPVNEPARPADTPVASYGAHEAGGRAQILRSVDFEALQEDWLEPLGTAQASAQDESRTDPDSPLGEDGDGFERTFGRGDPS